MAFRIAIYNKSNQYITTTSSRYYGLMSVNTAVDSLFKSHIKDNDNAEQFKGFANPKGNDLVKCQPIAGG
jgi:hypothetical protein